MNGPSTASARALWSRAVAHPVWTILAIVAAQYALTLWSKDLWFADEVRHGAVLRDLLNEGHWMALSLNGELYPDKPPLYFWYLAAIWTIFGTTEPWAMYLGLAGTAAMFHLSTFHMARRIFGDGDRALIAVMIQASGFYLVLIGHYARMDLAFSAAIVLAWTQLYLALAHGLSRVHMVRAFAFMGLAAMIKGPVGVLFPLLSLLGFVAWLRRPGLLIDRSVLGGLALAVGIIALWAGGLIWAAGPGFFAHLFETQIVDRGLTKETTPLGPVFYLFVVPVNFLPWTLMALFFPLAVLAPRRMTPDTAFLWISVALGALSLTLISEKHSYYIIPLLAPLSLLAAKGYAALSAERVRRFWTLALGLTAVFGLVLISGPLVARFDIGDYGEAARSLPLPGAVLLLGALALVRFGRGARRRLAGFVALQSVFVTVVALVVFPPLDRVLSPVQVTQAMAPWIERGHAPAAHHGRDGVFAYHLAMHYHDAQTARDLRRWLEEQPKAVVVMAHELWWRGRAGYEDLAPVDCVRFANRGIIVLVQPAPADAPRIRRQDCETP